MKFRDYCCCAIPLINAGIYLTLIEQLVAGVLVGVLSMATPSIVGAATPSFAPWVFGIVCIVAGAIQLLGFIGVAQEKPILFRRYISLHSLATTAVFSIALAWIILSATRHSTAKSNCLTNFFSNATSEEKSEGQTLCNIFPWAEVGVMGGLWVVMAIMHIYLYVVINTYSSGQQRDHAKYDALDSATFRNENIAMNNRFSGGTVYPSRDMGNNEYSHLRKESAASMSDVMAEPVQRPSDNFSLGRQGSYPPPSQRAPTLPPNAYTEDESPTPRVGPSYYTGNSGTLGEPPLSQAHPAEGSFGRKTPRLTKNRTFDDGYR